MKHISHLKMGSSNLGWLKSLFHFSFADYYNPENIQYGVLRVINDDLIAPQSGFERHPHRNMEIISYVVEGTLTHGDSMGNKRQLTRGQVQFMTAGSGIYHSEHNLGDQTARFLQIWILTDKNGHTPNYGDYSFPWDDRINQWLHLVSNHEGNAPIHVHQDVNLYATEISPGNSQTFSLQPGRQGYLVLIEGQATIDGIHLTARDALEFQEETITITATHSAHILLIEMPK